MNTLLQKDFERIASLYLDGELEPQEAKKFEEYLSQNFSAAAEFEQLKRVQKELKNKKQLPANDWFWLKLSAKIEEKENRKKTIILSHRPAFAFSSLIVLTAFVVGFIYFKEAKIFKQFFEEKKNFVTEGLLSGNILPFFSNLDNDKVLQFALLGNLAIDSANTTELQIKHDSEKGTRIEFATIDEPSAIKPITVKEFYQKIGIRNKQKVVVDSLLEKYTERLQASVLVDENNTIAINEELVNLNKVIVSTIAAALEPHQRVKFQEFLETKNAPYTIVASNVPGAAPEKVFRHIRSLPRSNKFVVISSDTVGIAEVQMNLDSIREYSLKTLHKVQAEKMLALETMKEALDKQGIVRREIAVAERPVRIVNSDDVVQIHFSNEFSAPSHFNEVGFEDFVKPRVIVKEFPRNGQVKVFTHRIKVLEDSTLVMEMNADSLAVKFFRSVPQGAMQFEIVDSIMSAPKMRIKVVPEKQKKSTARAWEQKREKPEQELIDLDSLLNEANKKNVAPTKTKTTKLMEL